MHDLDPKIIDAGIRELVFFLRKNGFNTSFSCQGGKGHATTVPTIWFYISQDVNPEPFRKQLEEFMFREGFECFSTYSRYTNQSYQQGGYIFKDIFVYLEVYGWHMATKNGSQIIILPPTKSPRSTRA